MKFQTYETRCISLILLWQITTKNNNKEKRIRKTKIKTHNNLCGSTLSLYPWAKTKKNFQRKLQFFKLSNPKSPIYTPKKKNLLFWSKSLPIFFPNYKWRFYIGSKVYNCQRYLFLKRRSHNRIFSIIIGNPLSIISYIRKLLTTFQMDTKYNLRHFLTISTFAQIPKIQTNSKVFQITSLPRSIGAFRYY